MPATAFFSLRVFILSGTVSFGLIGEAVFVDAPVEVGL